MLQPVACELCGGEDHNAESHDTEIMKWLSADPANGDTNGRMYYADRRRIKPNYKGLRQDVWWMMHNPAYRW